MDRGIWHVEAKTGTWQHFQHGSDIGIRGLGPSLPVAFEQAALSLTAVISELASVKPDYCIAVAADGDDDEFLFLNWIDALVFEMATRRMLFSRFEVSVAHHHLAARCWGETIDVSRHQPAVEVKGATFTELKVLRQPDGSWLAQCVVDV